MGEQAGGSGLPVVYEEICDMRDGLSEHRARGGLSSFWLHMIAMLFMLCDHLWGTFLIQYDVLTYVGRLAFPLFAFMLVEGFTHTKDRKKYTIRLLVFAILSEIPFNLMMEHRCINPFHQNVLWTFLLGMLLMGSYERIRRKKHLAVRLLSYGAVTVVFYLLGIVTFVDYYGYGILTIALFYFTRMPASVTKSGKIWIRIAQAAGMYWINCEMMAGLILTFSVFGVPIQFYKQGFALLALPLIWLYNGKQGYYNQSIKNFYYWFYPVHMAVLGALITLL